ncbi:hypothetical protein VE02_03458 [Pseudogymnoascus sp. 03VT05]|nr:hypothetical protein VE02_03458 [Pseudogymnoascus sp. 03VT05]
MKFTTIFFGLTAVVSGVLASPVSSLDSSPLFQRADCAFDSCIDCENFCYRDMPCPPDHNCGINQTGCILLCFKTNCCK